MMSAVTAARYDKIAVAVDGDSRGWDIGANFAPACSGCASNTPRAGGGGSWKCTLGPSSQSSARSC